MNTVITTLFFSLVVSKASATLLQSRAPHFTGCNANQQRDIQAAAEASKNLAIGAQKYLTKRTETRPGIFPEHFGQYGEVRSMVVNEHFNYIQDKFDTLRYDCTTCETQDPSAYPNARTYIDEAGVIIFCGAFWRKKVTGLNSRAGNILRLNLEIHESRMTQAARARIQDMRRGGRLDTVIGKATYKEYQEFAEEVRASSRKPKGLCLSC